MKFLQDFLTWASTIPMDSLKIFWTMAYIIGLALFAVMALIIIPLGFRDLIRLFARLNEDRGNGVDPAENPQPTRRLDEPA
jgi:hypothetical protein